MISPIISINPRIMSDEIQRLKNKDIIIDTSLDNIQKTASCMGAKNLIPYPYNQTTQTIHGVTVTDLGDGSLDFHGTSDAQGVKFNCSANDVSDAIPLEKTKYLLTWGNTTSPRLDITIVKQDDTTENILGTDGYILLDNSEGTYKSMYYLRFRTSLSSTFDHLVIYPMLRIASFTDESWAPYAKTNKELTDDIAELSCNETTAGTYKLQATVAVDGSITYEWVEVV